MHSLMICSESRVGISTRTTRANHVLHAGWFARMLPTACAAVTVTCSLCARGGEHASSVVWVGRRGLSAAEQSHGPAHLIEIAAACVAS